MSKDTVISVKNVSKTFKIPHEKISTMRGAFVGMFRKRSYEEFKALDNVSFEIKKGEFFGVIGRNGSGKSTLLKVLAGIYTPDSGKIEINGRISPFLELGIGFNPELSGRDNIYLNATVLGLTKKQIDQKFNDIVNFSELKRFIDQKIKNYSSGMQVRLAFSVAIHANRDILLMDEVLAVGDTNFQQKCLEEFSRYRDLGKTVILVTHDIGTVQRYCDRAMLLRNGKIEAIGNSEQVGSKYVEQSISDEEKRLSDETNGPDEFKQEEGSGNTIISKKTVAKKAVVEKVHFLSKEGNIKKVFSTGEDIVARIYYEAREEIKKPVFGVALYTQDGIHICGPNTKTSEFDIPRVKGKGFIDFILSNNPLFTGVYYFTVGIFNYDCVLPFDLKDKAFSFKVISDENNQLGIVKLSILWKK